MKTAISKSPNTATPEEDRAYWEHHVQSQKVSGTSRAAYCRINHVNYGRMTYWLKNNKQTPQTNISVIPIKLKPEVSHEVNTDGDGILCTLKLKTGVTILIHDKEALCLLVKEMM